ncbi:hypothetical protein FHU41_001858 [Psychromicrobium silvestre]|uniref:Uncharacterized protein n=1 Tax=Psychromicrobium silvestre TaxID=1645614 RepID=A0A7Y9LU21_9MICC|nr:hypothetical protein [Psychromicrobium silvestre]NYE95608.1 hypothetical protein [Psychromicrobium silvestre]
MRRLIFNRNKKLHRQITDVWEPRIGVEAAEFLARPRVFVSGLFIFTIFLISGIFLELIFRLTGPGLIITSSLIILGWLVAGIGTPIEGLKRQRKVADLAYRYLELSKLQGSRPIPRVALIDPIHFDNHMVMYNIPPKSHYKCLAQPGAYKLRARYKVEGRDGYIVGVDHWDHPLRS